MELIKDIQTSLKELYLNEVYIKIFGRGETGNIPAPLWIGHHEADKPAGAFWVADELRSMEDLALDFLRVTGLGYDDFDEPDRQAQYPNFDLVDPSGLGRSFDQRFVEAIIPPIEKETKQTTLPNPAVGSLPNLDAPLDETNSHLIEEATIEFLSTPTEAQLAPPDQPRPPIYYDLETWQRHHNSTSHFKKCIDGYFINRNQQALLELQRIISVADQGMALISEEIDRTHTADVAPDGNVVIP